MMDRKSDSQSSKISAMGVGMAIGIAIGSGVGASFSRPSINRLHEDDDDFHACGVDDVEGVIPANAQINTFSDDR